MKKTITAVCMAAAMTCTIHAKEHISTKNDKPFAEADMRNFRSHNDNPLGLVYAGAITNNEIGRVNIHPIIYDLNGLKISANVYTPAGYDAAKNYPALVVAHPNGGVKEQVSGLYSQRLAEQGYICLAFDAAYQGASEGEPCNTDKPAHRIGEHILVTHSAGGFPGWTAAMRNEEVRGVVSYEPGGFVFPEGEVPDPISGLTGGAAGITVPTEQFERLTQIPIVLYFGDFIPETPSKNLGDENWRVRLHMARKFVETINWHGGNATLIELPKIGIYGNTHFLMQDLNNTQLAGLLDEWLLKSGLGQSDVPVNR